MKSSLSVLLLTTLIVLAPGCGSDFYTLDDFTKVKKVDTHTHINALNTSMAEQAIADNFLLLTINVDVPTYPPLDEQKKYALHQIEKSPDNVKFLTAFTLQNWSSPD